MHDATAFAKTYRMLRLPELHELPKKIIFWLANFSVIKP